MRRCREIASWVFFSENCSFINQAYFFNCYLEVWLQVKGSKTEQFWESVLLKNHHMGVPMYCFLWSGRTSRTSKKTLPKIAAIRCSCSKNKKGGVFFLGINFFLFWELIFFPFAFAFAAFAFAFAFPFGAFTFGAFTFDAFAFGAFAFAALAFGAFAFAAFAFDAFAFAAFAFGAFAFAAFAFAFAFAFAAFAFAFAFAFASATFCSFGVFLLLCCIGLSFCFYIYFAVVAA